MRKHVIVVNCTLGNTKVTTSYTTAHLWMEEILEKYPVNDITGSDDAEALMMEGVPCHRTYWFKHPLYESQQYVSIDCRRIWD